MVTVQTHNGDNGLDKLTPAGGDQSLEHNVYHHDVENVYVDDAGYDTVSCKNLLRSALVTGVTAPVCCCSENMIKILFLHSCYTDPVIKVCCIFALFPHVCEAIMILAPASAQ